MEGGGGPEDAPAGIVEPMRVGDAITVVVFNLDGTRRRWWTSTVEAIDSRLRAYRLPDR